MKDLPEFVLLAVHGLLPLFQIMLIVAVFGQRAIKQYRKYRCFLPFNQFQFSNLTSKNHCFATIKIRTHVLDFLFLPQEKYTFPRKNTPLWQCFYDQSARVEIWLCAQNTSNLALSPHKFSLKNGSRPKRSQNAANYSVFEPTMRFICIKKKPPPAKTDYIGASGKNVLSNPQVLWFQFFCKARLTFI